jgi:hypothetical protein
MATKGRGISHGDTKHSDKCSSNETKQHRNKVTKPQTNTFSKYCNDKTKQLHIKYTHIIQGPYNKQYEKYFCTYYE